MEEKNLSKRLNDLFDQVKDYMQLRLDFFTLSLGEYVVFLLARMIIVIVLFWTGVLATVFFSGALVAWIGTRTGNWPVALLVGAGIFVFIGFFIFLFRKSLIINPLNRLYVKLLDLKKKDEGHE